LLYEFETKARLGNADLDTILDRAVALPYAEPKVFEIMAGKSNGYVKDFINSSNYCCHFVVH